MLYALVALSMTVVYRATTIVNFGHGDMVAAGAYVVFFLGVTMGLPFVAALAASIAALFAFGVLMQRGLMQPIGGGPHLSLAMMALAAGFALRGAERLEWGNETLAIPRPYPSITFLLGNIVVTTDDLVITGLVLVLLIALFVVFKVSPIGRLVQAVFQTERGAALVGINVPAFHAAMWGIGGALGAIGGALLALIVPLTPDMGQWVLLQAFAAMTLGGFGSLGGAVLGGVLLGVLQNVLGFYLGTVFIEITAYVVTILVLLIRPSGLFGRQAAVRV